MGNLREEEESDRGVLLIVPSTSLLNRLCIGYICIILPETTTPVYSSTYCLGSSDHWLLLSIQTWGGNSSPLLLAHGAAPSTGIAYTLENGPFITLLN